MQSVHLMSLNQIVLLYPAFCATRMGIADWALPVLDGSIFSMCSCGAATLQLYVLWDRWIKYNQCITYIGKIMFEIIIVPTLSHGMHALMQCVTHLLFPWHHTDIHQLATIYVPSCNILPAISMATQCILLIYARWPQSVYHVGFLCIILYTFKICYTLVVTVIGLMSNT